MNANLDNLQELCYNTFINADGLKRESESVMKRTTKQALFLCLILFASLLMFTSCNSENAFESFPEITQSNNEQTTPQETTPEETTPEETTPEETTLFHIWSAWTIIKEAQCEEVGLTQRYCIECYYTESKPIDALGHTEVINQAVAPSCTQNGLTEGEQCAECNKIFVPQEIVKALGHTEVIDKAVAPTCTESGITEGKHCDVCSEILVAQKVVPKNGHSFEEWYVTKEATESEKGEKRRDCSSCTAFETSPIAELAHDHNNWAVITLESVNPTCAETGLTEGKKCSGCNEILVAQTVVPTIAHTEVIDEAVAPTCTETGLTQGEHCSVCNEIIVAQTTVKAKGHTEVIDNTVAPTCTTTGLTEGKHCSVCAETLVAQEIVPAKGHDYGDWITIKVPTESENGLQERVCTCGEKETRDIDENIFEMVEVIIPKLSMFESIFKKDSRGWCMYNDIMGEAVTAALDKQDLLIAGGCNAADIHLAGQATENLRVLLKGYNDLRVQTWSSEYEKNKALYNYYSENYEALTENFCNLYRTLKGLYENAAVSNFIGLKGKTAHYRQLVGHLFVVSTALDQNVYRDEDAWRIDRKTLREVIEDVHYFPDGNWYPEELQ